MALAQASVTLFIEAGNSSATYKLNVSLYLTHGMTNQDRNQISGMWVLYIYIKQSTSTPRLLQLLIFPPLKMK